MPAPTARAHVSILLDDDVPELGPAAEEAAVDDDAAADAGAEREHHEVLRAAPGAAAPLGERGGARVVLDPDREPEALARPRDEIDVVEREVHRAQDAPRAALEVRRDAVADRGDALVEERLDGLVQSREHAFLRSVRARDLALCVDSPSRSTRPERIFVPPTSSTDDDGSLHAGRNDNAAHGSRDDVDVSERPGREADGFRDLRERNPRVADSVLRKRMSSSRPFANHEAPKAQIATHCPISKDRLGPPASWVTAIQRSETTIAPPHAQWNHLQKAGDRRPGTVRPRALSNAEEEADHRERSDECRGGHVVNRLDRGHPEKLLQRCRLLAAGRPVGSSATRPTATPASVLSVLSSVRSATLYVTRNTPIALSVPTKTSRTPE